MLALVGLGIEDEDDITIKGLEVLKTADIVYGELYTCPLDVNKEKLEKMIGKKVEWLSRKEVEENNKVIKAAEKKNVAFLVGGDPLAATTHQTLILECRKQGIKCKVFHSSSIFSAIAETGLFIYKFGKTVSLPKPETDYNPLTPYNNIEDNIKSKLHTLLLLDIGMTANEAISILEDIEKKKKKKHLAKKKIVVASHLGENSLVAYGTMQDLKQIDFGKMPHSIVIPGDLHFHEEEFLQSIEVVPVSEKKEDDSESGVEVPLEGAL